jgi:subtilase family serine protease
VILNPWGAASFAVAKPDLVVSISDPPASARAGDPLPITSVVTNQGQALADASTTKFYLVAGSTRKNLKGVQLIGALAPGQSDNAAVALSVYSDTDPGTYSVQACADADEVVSEVTEGNNCTTTTGAITILESPDLIVSSINNPTSSAGQGQPITVKSTVKNIGAVDADPTITKYYLVPTAGGPKDDLKGEQPVPLLKPGQTFSAQMTMTIRPETAPGQYKLQACADTGKTAPEVDENNNCLTSSGNIQVTPQPNLIVTSVVAGLPKTVVAGDDLAITVVVKNAGLAQAKASTMKYVIINTVSSAEKNLNGTATIPIIEAGQSATVQKTVKVYSDTASATYSVQACADSAKAITETFESDNCKLADGVLTVQGIVVGHSDLVVTAVPNPPSSVLPGAAFDLPATVANQGTDPAPASTTSFYLVNTSTGAKKNLKGGQDVPALDPGASASPPAPLSLYSDTLPGTYFVQACADGPKGVSEEAEGNNCLNAAGTITVQQVPNLVVSSITNPPGTASLGGKFSLTNSVRNLGSVVAGASSTKYYLVSTVDGTKQDLKGTQAVPALNAGQTFSLLVTLEVRALETLPGQYKVQACADGGKDVTESNEDDNCLTSSGIVKVVGPPDLVVTQVTVRNAPLTVARGGSLTITAALKNLGEGSAAGSTMKYLLVHTVTGATKNLNGTQAYPALNTGSSTSIQKVVTIFLDTPVGTYNVQACADSGEIVPEVSETNNCTTTTSNTATVTVN